MHQLKDLACSLCFWNEVYLDHMHVGATQSVYIPHLMSSLGLTVHHVFVTFFFWQLRICHSVEPCCHFVPTFFFFYSIRSLYCSWTGVQWDIKRASKKSGVSLIFVTLFLFNCFPGFQLLQISEADLINPWQLSNLQPLGSSLITLTILKYLAKELSFLSSRHDKLTMPPYDIAPSSPSIWAILLK